MTNLLLAILIGVGGGTTAVGIVPQAPAQPVTSSTTGVVLALPCHEDEIPVVMPHDWVPADGDRWIADLGMNDTDGEIEFSRLCIAQDDYDEALLDAYIDTQS